MDEATAQVDQISDMAHRAVNSAAGAATSAAEWARAFPSNKQVQTKVTDARAHVDTCQPISTVAAPARRLVRR